LDFTLEGNPARIARELEKGGAQVSARMKASAIELILAGDVEVSLAASREECFAHPGTKPEVRFSTSWKTFGGVISP